MKILTTSGNISPSFLNVFYPGDSMNHGRMSRQRSLTIIAALAVIIAAVYLVALRPATIEGTVDHKTITGTRDQASYSIVVFTVAGSHYDDKELRGIFEDTGFVNDTALGRLEVRYDEVFYVLSVRTDDGTTGYFVTRKDFNRVVPGSRIRYTVQASDEMRIIVRKVLY